MRAHFSVSDKILLVMGRGLEESISCGGTMHLFQILFYLYISFILMFNYLSEVAIIICIVVCSSYNGVESSAVAYIVDISSNLIGQFTILL